MAEGHLVGPGLPQLQVDVQCTDQLRTHRSRRKIGCASYISREPLGIAGELVGEWPGKAHMAAWHKQGIFLLDCCRVRYLRPSSFAAADRHFHTRRTARTVRIGNGPTSRVQKLRRLPDPLSGSGFPGLPAFDGTSPRCQMTRRDRLLESSSPTGWGMCYNGGCRCGIPRVRWHGQCESIGSNQKKGAQT